VADNLKLNHPWLVAVWPGMGHVALNAGIYLLSKLEMTAVAEFEANDLFDVEQVEVKGGIIQPVRRPRNRFFVWTDPDKKRDLLVFLGEAQPPVGRFAFCRQVVQFAKKNGAERVLTFAAMATRMHPEHKSRVFGAATDTEDLDEIKRLDLELVEDGHIGGLNGVLLAAAADAGLRGACLLGEMPHIFAQLPFPKASLAILDVFNTLTGIDLDLTELETQAKAVEEQLGELLARVEEQYGRQGEEEGEENEDNEDDGGGDGGDEPKADEGGDGPRREGRMRKAARARIEDLFAQAAKDRSKAFELKQELDRHGLFKEYEDRFLDLFKKPG
jgi:proteasome assembly chaperone (PAC2) family protein